ncbi:MAG TPA: ABC transporter ATP-binding protein [Mycobacteriales bacterium]|jgi:spermidine/putrescine ABC transporter ATP-binding subunit|nr:ABC transporter ATP-binding protein [Mycobacteriales bacterium]
MTAATDEVRAPQAAEAGHDPAGGGVPAIELVSVAKEFVLKNDLVAAVDHIDLAIDQGEFFSMLGPSGCGKTTTLRMIAGFEEPTSGKVLLYGSDVTSVPPNKRDVNMVFQNYALFPHMSVEDNIAFGLERTGVAKAEVKTRVTDALDLVELSGRGRRRPKELSGGQQQRVALARALVNRPRALLLDEPLGALDLKLRQTMQIELKRIQREVGITFVYVTHDQSEALTMSDRLIVMHDGRIEQLGSPKELYEQPKTRFVAGFIGTSNILRGTVASVEDGKAVLRTGGEEVVLIPMRAPVTAGETLEATVRPEKMQLNRERPAGCCALRATVQEIVYLGTSTNYTVATALGELVVYQLNAGEDLIAPDRGEQLWATWPTHNGYQLLDTAPHQEDDNA